jgi:hypothetical protein
MTHCNCGLFALPRLTRPPAAHPSSRGLPVLPRLCRLLCGESPTHRPHPTPKYFPRGYAALVAYNVRKNGCSSPRSRGVTVARYFSAGGHSG